MKHADRIRQARELLGLTQEQLAERIGVSQPVIAQLEAGAYDAPNLIATIAFRTGFPPSFFADPYVEDFPLGSLQFRGHARLTRKDRLQAHRYGQLVYELFRRVSTKTKSIQITLPQIDDGVLRAATETRSAMGLSPDTPIAHLINSAERIGVTILVLPVDLNGRDAFSAWAGDRPVIALSAGRPGDRIRLTVAHELGHLVMHRAIRRNVQEMEKEAYAFAAELLMPQTAMLAEMLRPVTLTTLAPMKLRWKVSIQALIRRARDLGSISERQSYYLSEQIGRAGKRLDEGENLAIPAEKPRALRQIVEIGYGRPIDYRKLARDTNLTPKMLQAIISEHAEGKKPQSAKAPSNVLPLRLFRS